MCKKSVKKLYLFLRDREGQKLYLVERMSGKVELEIILS
jgi:hypothetical protein